MTATQSVGQLRAKLEALEERYAFGEVNAEIFDRVSNKLKAEVNTINDQIRRDTEYNLSNPFKLVSHALKI